MKKLTFILSILFVINLSAQVPKATHITKYVGSKDGCKYTLEITVEFSYLTQILMEKDNLKTLFQFEEIDTLSYTHYTLSSEQQDYIRFTFEEKDAYSKNQPPQVEIELLTSDFTIKDSCVLYLIEEDENQNDNDGSSSAEIDNFYTGILEKSFSYFKWVDADEPDYFLGSRFGYDEESFKLNRVMCQNLPKDDICYIEDNSEFLLLLGRYKNSSMKETYNILYSPGPSADPVFYITDSKNKEIWAEAADEMCINNNGIIYIAGSSNKMFNQRMKFSISNNGIKEVKQAYYYVGIKNKTLKPIVLYSQKKGGAVVARLPKGYEIEVLLSETDYFISEDGFGLPSNYLVRTAFGLVGWLRLSGNEDKFDSPVVNELRYQGD